MRTPGPWHWWQEGDNAGIIEPDSKYFHECTGSVPLDFYRGGQESVRLIGPPENGLSEYVPTDCILSVDYKPNADNARLICSAPKLLEAIRMAIHFARNYNGQLSIDVIRELELAHFTAVGSVDAEQPDDSQFSGMEVRIKHESSGVGGY